jgi:hypothetical protein
MKLNEYCSDKLKLPLCVSEGELRTAAVIVEKRNLLTHNRGIVNKRFLERVPDCQVGIGDKLIIHEGEAGEELAFLCEAVFSLDKRACGKFGVQQNEIPGRDLLELVGKVFKLYQEHRQLS